MNEGNCKIHTKDRLDKCLARVPAIIIRPDGTRNCPKLPVACKCGLLIDDLENPPCDLPLHLLTIELVKVPPVPEGIESFDRVIEGKAREFKTA